MGEDGFRSNCEGEIECLCIKGGELERIEMNEGCRC